MNKVRKAIQLNIYIVLLGFWSCQNSPVNKVQGVFSADKVSLKTSMEEKLTNQNRLASALLNKVIENAIVEFKIEGDSINGIIFLAGQTTILRSKIQVRNDSMIVKAADTHAYLIPNEKGLMYKNKTSETGIQMLKTDSKTLSSESTKALSTLVAKEKEQREFTANLGQWQVGNLVDEFGDNTGDSYPYSVVQGNHENSAVLTSEVYVKSFIQGDNVFFQIFNGSMNLKETFPDSEFGTIKVKFPNGDVKTERIFFYKNSVSESPQNGTPLIFTHLTSGSGDLKILIDLSTASRYHSDKYQFTIGPSNLADVLSKNSIGN